MRALEPSGFILELACDDLATLCWRLRLATRLEQGHLARLLASEPTGEPSAPPSGPDRNDAARFCGSSPMWSSASASGARFPPISSRRRGSLGAEFVQILAEWRPVNYAYLMMAENTIKKAALSRRPPPCEPPTPEQEERYEALIADTRYHAQLKILYLKRLELEAGKGQNRAVGSGGTSPGLETYIGYVSRLRGELQRSLKYYVKTLRPHFSPPREES